MRPKIGLITIGQSPRQDVVSDIVSILGPKIEIIERGALDGLSKKRIEVLHPEKNDFPLITRLMDGSPVVVGKRKIIPLIQKQISALDKLNVELMAFLCTDDFPGLKSQKILLLPYPILLSMVTSMMREGTLAVLAPLKEQKETVKRKWQKTGLEIIIEIMNPYARRRDRAASPSPSQCSPPLGQSFKFEQVVKNIQDHQVDLIVLDCIGYSSKVKEKIRQATGKSVLSPRTILARMIQELL